LTNSSKSWTAYEAAFRADVHQLLAWGYEDARNLINSSSQEEEITGFIVEAIEKRLDDPETDGRFDRYEVGEDKPLPGEKRTGKRRRRADIRIRSTLSKPRPRYLLEGKRLRKAGFGLPKYLGRDGLLRFVDRTSYSDYTGNISMIAYVQSETPRDWASELETVFSDASQAELKSMGRFLPDPATLCLEHCFYSVHLRDTGEKINIYHVLLDCT
jgi:hypothetical protein